MASEGKNYASQKVNKKQVLTTLQGNAEDWVKDNVSNTSSLPNTHVESFALNRIQTK